MASGLMKLEHLKVSRCPVLEVLAYSENGGEGVIKFQKLKFLSLKKLPKFVGFCNTVNVVELPQLVEMILESLPNFTSIYPDNTSTKSSMYSNITGIQPFFNKEVVIPKLEILKIYSMDKLKEIWPYQVSSGDEVNTCLLREIRVYRCDNIVNLFPINPMPLLHHLEELVVSGRGSIHLEVLFNIDMSYVGEIEEYSSNLRYIKVSSLPKLRELWRMKGASSCDILIHTFQSVERIEIERCESFVNIFTPTVTNSDVRTLMNVSIDGRRPWEESLRNDELVEKSQEINVVSKAEISEASGCKNVEFSIGPIPIFHHLEELHISDCKDVEVVFEIESSSSSNTDFTTAGHNHQPRALLPYLKVLVLMDIHKMSDVWKCNWNKLVIPKNQSQSSFQNLTTLYVMSSKSIKYLFSSLCIKFLYNLKDVTLDECDGIEEVVSNRYDENDEMATSISTHTDTMSFPLLENLYLTSLPRLKSIDGGDARDSAITSGTTTTTNSIHVHFKVGVASWLLCQYSKNITIRNCPALSRVFPSYVVRQLNNHEELTISERNSMLDQFESATVNNDGAHSTNSGDRRDDTCTTITIPRSTNMTLLELPNLKILEIKNCELLEYIFTTSTLESLKQLEELTVQECKAMKVIVKEDGQHTETSKTIVFPRLKSLTLVELLDLKGFFLGMNEFKWPLLEKVKMYGCPQMMMFTFGHSMPPKLNYIHTGLGKHSLECGLNFHLANLTHEIQLPMCSPNLIELLQFPWSFSNIVEVDTQEYGDKLLDSRIIFPCNELLNLKSLEYLYIYSEYDESTIEEVFEVAEWTNDDMDIQTQTVVVFEKLKEITLDRLSKLRHMWKRNLWIVLNFPNLTKVSINDCSLLGHVFTCDMVGSLLQLQELRISYCKTMDVIVKQVEDSETRATEAVFPCLKSITLDDLPNLKGFYLGKEDFLWPSLATLEIKDCPQITVFTNGKSTTPELKLIDTTFGLCHSTEDPNSFIITKQQEGWQF